MEKEITNAELIREIRAKAKRAKPAVQKPFFKLLERSTKAELKRIRKAVRVSRDGYDIRFD